MRMRLKAAIVLLVLAQAGGASAVKTDCRGVNGYDMACRANGSDGVPGRVTLKVIMGNAVDGTIEIYRGKCGARLELWSKDDLKGIPGFEDGSLYRFFDVGADECVDAVLSRCRIRRMGGYEEPARCLGYGQMEMQRR